MKAIVNTKYGAPEVLQIAEVKKPVPNENEVLVKVKAASITTADGMMRTGKPYVGRLFMGLTKPKQAVIGTGFAGIVESVGSEVTLYKKGDEIFGESLFSYGTNAEYTCVPELGVISIKPNNISFEEAAVVCDGALTSINFLKEVANIQPNQKVLINGASGSLGTAAIQLAKHFGAEVTAVCSASNFNLVKQLGVDFTIDYSQEDFTISKNKYDIIYDTIGKRSFSNCKRVLSKRGKYISPVLGFPLLRDVLCSSIFEKKKAKFSATGVLPAEKLSQLLRELVDLIEDGKLVSVIDKKYKMEDIVEAHTYIGTGRKKGNTVLLID